jgi:hypothetical protein
VLTGRVAAARRALADEGFDFVLHSMWTVPAVERTRAYLSVVRDIDDVIVAREMRRYPRNNTVDNDVLNSAGASNSTSQASPARSRPSSSNRSPPPSSHIFNCQRPRRSLQLPGRRPDSKTGARIGDELLVLPGGLNAGGDGCDGDGNRTGEGTSTGYRSPAVEDPYSVVDTTPHELRVPVSEAGGDAGMAEAD